MAPNRTPPAGKKTTNQPSATPPAKLNAKKKSDRKQKPPASSAYSAGGFGCGLLGLAAISMTFLFMQAPPRYMRYRIRRLILKFKSKKMILKDGVKIIWPTGWVHIRASNTEPIMRVIAEAKTVKEAKRLYTLVKKNIRIEG